MLHPCCLSKILSSRNSSPLRRIPIRRPRQNKWQQKKEKGDGARTLLNVPLAHLVHAPPLPALEYVPGSHCTGASVTDEEHLDPAGHVVHVSVAPLEYVPFPQVSWAVAPMGAFARWPGATVAQPVTYFVVCSEIGQISQSKDRKRITLGVLTA